MSDDPAADLATRADIERLERSIARLREAGRVFLPLAAFAALLRYSERGYDRAQLVTINETVHAVLVKRERNRVFLLAWDGVDWKPYQGGLVMWLKAMLPDENLLWGTPVRV